MIKTLLIANRGEIACRIIKTAKKHNIKTIAVYSDIDQEALHVKLADSAICLGAAPAKQSYLNIAKIIDVAKQTKADAIHPGYGFLSENASFAQACIENNIIFVGPPVEAIKTMGSKKAARELMQQAGVPVVPGYDGHDQSADNLLSEAKKIGFPVMLKASAGGGGKGMRIVDNEAHFLEALTSAKREAKSAFNDDVMLIEKYVASPRHIEIQVFADTHGNYVHLFERDCSIQRRHQKVIEEAPAYHCPLSLREALCEAAVNAAKAIDYVGAGTVEMLVDEEHQFYFMEMNTRLQVEHPVTEMITGEDLVAWQLAVAEGKTLPKQQNELSIAGHAVEARIYAEDSKNQFLPSSGKIWHLHYPLADHIRVDSGIQQHDHISTYYDPMLAKVVAWGETRPEAISRLKTALENTQIAGLKTNVSFITDVLSNTSFVSGDINTSFIEQHIEQLLLTQQAKSKQCVILANLVMLLKHTHPSISAPWSFNHGWTHQGNCRTQNLILHDQENTYQSSVRFINENTYQIELNDEQHYVSGEFISDNRIEAKINEQPITATTAFHGDEFVVFYHGAEQTFRPHDLSAIELEGVNEPSNFMAPMAATVIEICVKPLSNVNPGDKIMVLEAMKMEHTVLAPQSGVVKNVHYQVGDLVNEGVELLEFEAE